MLWRKGGGRENAEKVTVATHTHVEEEEQQPGPWAPWAHTGPFGPCIQAFSACQLAAPPRTPPQKQYPDLGGMCPSIWGMYPSILDMYPSIWACIHLPVTSNTHPEEEELEPDLTVTCTIIVSEEGRLYTVSCVT